MRKKKIVSIGLIMGLIMAAGSFIFFWPHAVQAENETVYAGDYSRLWDYSYNNWEVDYTAWQSPSFNYSTSWDDNYLRSGQSYIAATEADFLGLLSQGTTVYVPPGSFAYANAYGTLGSPGGYFPSAQWPAYSYAMPSSPFGMYEFQPYPGGPIIGSMRPMPREEWWANEVEGWDNPEKYVRERWPNVNDDERRCLMSVLFPIHDRPTVPPWEEQPNFYHD